MKEIDVLDPKTKELILMTEDKPWICPCCGLPEYSFVKLDKETKAGMLVSFQPEICMAVEAIFAEREDVG